MRKKNQMREKEKQNAIQTPNNHMCICLEVDDEKFIPNDINAM